MCAVSHLTLALCSFWKPVWAFVALHDGFLSLKRDFLCLSAGLSVSNVFVSIIQCFSTQVTHCIQVSDVFCLYSSVLLPRSIFSARSHGLLANMYLPPYVSIFSCRRLQFRVRSPIYFDTSIRMEVF